MSMDWIISGYIVIFVLIIGFIFFISGLVKNNTPYVGVFILEVIVKDKILKRLGRPFEWLCVGALYMVAVGLFIGSIGIITLGIKIAWFGTTF